MIPKDVENVQRAAGLRAWAYADSFPIFLLHPLLQKNPCVIFDKYQWMQY